MYLMESSAILDVNFLKSDVKYARVHISKAMYLIVIPMIQKVNHFIQNISADPFLLALSLLNLSMYKVT